ncbi:YegS/Rv2252/BmrU family lipid kinase [Oculatella sp. LEGE 06141]|uniref:YegS/Rv2252/BmrU family lipid kinase n=1 Tax=Oculatella sp. LEGE 06141 TaxID=1828648 RepID=UPI00187F8082|nr:YegS/Rv2252/BmrU family lipid kinase [Oculatella sp. LEGE 06141]MBE9180965.1 YegS/Rv2252/BmrU family lipid kinase [Oculatella sp. LEGE 06141]
MQRSACLIFNPVAGQGNPDQDLTLIRRILEPELELDIRFTSKEIGAEQLAQEAIERGAPLIIASGGDGTLSAAANALIGRDIPLGIISRGTANAFAGALGIPDTIEAACETIVTGQIKTVDAALCNGKPMVLLAGIGFEAETVNKANREAKNRFGVLAYIIAGFRQLREMKRFLAEIETEDKTTTVTAIAVTVANAAPPTSVLAQGPAGLVADDGLLDLTIVAPMNKAGAIAAGYHLLKTALSGNAAKRRDIGYMRAQRFKIVTEPPQKVVLDGELIGNTPIEIECVPGSLNILVPANADEALDEKLNGLPDLVVELKDSFLAEP